MSKQSKTLHVMVFMAMYAALAIVLDYVRELIPFTSIWANGGSIDIGLIPIAFAAFHLGWKYGVATSLIEFVLSVALGATKIWTAGTMPALGFLCDYIFPLVFVGACSFLMKKDDRSLNKGNFIRIEAGVVIGMTLRIFSQVVSGAYCWPGDAASGSAAAWAYSFGYNFGYGIPTAIMLIVLIPILYKAFEKQIVKDL